MSLAETVVLPSDAFAQAQRRERLILESVDEGIYVVDAQERIVFANRSALTTLGWTEDAMIGREGHAINHPHAADGSPFPIEDCPIHQTLSDGEVQRVDDEVFFRRDGSCFPVEYVSSPVRDESGSVTGAVVSFRDVTAQRAAMEQLKETATLLRIAGRAARLGGWTIQLPERTLAWSDENCAIHDVPAGHTPTLQEGLDYYLPEDRGEVSRLIEACARDGTPYDFELPIVTAKGRHIWIRSVGEAVRDGEGKIIRLQGAFQDISERRRSEETLREQASLLDLARDAIVVRDLDHRVRYWNRSAERLYGWTADQARGHPVSELLYDAPEAYFAAAQITLETGEWVGEIEQLTMSGKRITVEGHWTLVRDDEGNPRSVLAINTDVTARKQLERQFLRAQRLESIGTLSGGIAHDFNNLLAPILMGVGYLQRIETREEVLKVIRNIETSANRGKELVRQVLSFARGIEGDRVPIRLADVVREVESIVASTFPKTIRFERAIGPDIWLVDGDLTQLNQVLMNLCVNARDAMPNGGRLSVTLRNAIIDEQCAVRNRGVAPGRYVALRVGDAGSGIARAVLDRMFEPFYTTKEFGKGTGLGLSTALAIVKSHGGFLDVESEVGRGTEFTIYLPAQSEGGARGETPPAEPEALPRGHGELILIVDDEVSILSIMRQTLEAFGYRTLEAEDGARAIALYADHRDEVAVVITDMLMPIMNGAALIAALNRIDPQIRIIAASAVDDEAGGKRGSMTGVTATLNKPYSVDRLLVLLRSLLPAPAE